MIRAFKKLVASPERRAPGRDAWHDGRL